jgi:hypothetical protein
MMVRPRKRAARRKGETPKAIALSATFPAPIRGWIINENLVAPSPGGASILDNFLCTTTGVRPRAGSLKRATLGAPVKSMFSYKSGVMDRFFAATDANIFDITTVADPETAPAAAVSGQTDGEYSTQQFGTAGGDYFYAVNGANDAQLYDGTTWQAVNGASTPIDITGVDTSNLSHVWRFANRLFFVEENTMVAHYLGVDSIGGTASQFSLAGVFSKGGSLLFGDTWSLDAGDGLDDKCVFVSTEGEVAIYEGTNPGNSADWRLEGVYEITKPLGKNATMQAGGDLLIATDVGMVPLSQAISKDKAALALNSVSAEITTYWQRKAAALQRPWQIIKWAEKNLMLVSQPGQNEFSCLAVNLQTKAWSRITNWNTNCLGYFDGDAFFGTVDGTVHQMERTGSDDGMPYTCAYLGLYEQLGSGVQKTVHQARATFQSRTPITPQVTVRTDYDETLSVPPNSVADFQTDAWGTAIWGTSTWGARPDRQTIARWGSVGRTGYSIAPEVQLTFGTALAPDAELAAFDMTYTEGALVA